MQHPQSTFKTRRGLFPLIASLFTLFFLFTLAGPAHAQTTIPIDDYSSGAQNLIINADDPAMMVFGETAASQAVGEWRKARIEKLPGSDDRLLNAVVSTTLEDFSITSGNGVDWRVTVIWDGDNSDNWDGDPTDISHNNFTVDLVNVNDEQIADGILLTVVDWDANDIDVTFIVYSGAANSSTATYEVRGNVFVDPYDVSLCFFEGCFETTTGTGADFEAVTAIVMIVESVDSSADITLDLTFAGPSRDFGDLPDSYTTLISSTTSPLDPAEEGPRHSRGNIYLGTCVSTELNGQPSSEANLDDCDDGIVPIGTNLDGQWVNGANGGTVSVTWTSPDTIGQSGAGNGSACLDGWINWDHRHSNSANHTFEDSANFDASEKHVVRGHKLATTSFGALTQNIRFDVPAGYFPGGTGDPVDLASRWRIYPVDEDGECPDGGLGVDGYKGYIINGEVEDYIWGFTPTSVALIGFQASTVALPWVVGVLVLTLLTGLLLVVRRRQTVTA